jgi:hypothetical protein
MLTPVAVATLGALTVATVSFAIPTTSTTNVAFISLTTPRKVLNAVSVAANKSTSAVIAGGTTTVPTNATAVKLTVTAKGTAGGTLNFYPAGNDAGGSGQYLSYPSGNSPVSATIEENIGQSDELTVANSGSGSAVVSMTVLAYSTQVTAGDLNGVGGTNGQVLTNDGVGGASWHDPAGPQTYASRLNDWPGNFTLTDFIPAGTYLVTMKTDGFSIGAATFNCSVQTPGFVTADYLYGQINPPIYDATPSTSILIDTIAPGNLTMNCFVGSGSVEFFFTSLIATLVTGNGYVVAPGGGGTQPASSRRGSTAPVHPTIPR